MACLILLILAANSCAQNPAQPTDLVSVDAVVQALQRENVMVARTGSMPCSAYPFFVPAAQTISVAGENVELFAYASSALANEDARRVSPTGTPIGQSQISWMDVPHFYKSDRIIALYVGHSANILRALKSVFGEPFAAGQ